MDPKEGDYVRFKHKRVEITGIVIKRSGIRIRVQPGDGGATLWKELSELLPLAPAVDEASEVAQLQRLFSLGPSSARAHALSSARVNALSAFGVQAAANPTVAGTPNKIGMPTSKPELVLGPLQAAPPEIKREVFEAAPSPHRPAIGPERPDAFRDDGDDTTLDDIDDRQPHSSGEHEPVPKSHQPTARPMDPKEGDYVRFKHKRVETSGIVIKRSGTRIRVQPKDGGLTLWKELSELLPLASPVDELSLIHI